MADDVQRSDIKLRRVLAKRLVDAVEDVAVPIGPAGKALGSPAVDIERDVAVSVPLLAPPVPKRSMAVDLIE